MKVRSTLILCGLLLFLPAAGHAEECGVLPANPNNLSISRLDPDTAYEMSEKGFEAYDANDFHCAAWFQAKAYESQPDPVLMQNISNALLDAGLFDAARRYAEKTLGMKPEPPEVEAANKVISDANKELSGFETVQLSDYEADAMEVDWIRYQKGDEPRLPKGNVKVSIERNGKAVDATIPVPKPVEVVEVPEPPSESSLDWRFWTGLGVGVVGLGLLGATFAIDASAGSKVEEYDALRACLEVSGGQVCADDGKTAADYNALGADIEDQTSIELITLIGGSVLTAAGLGLIIWNLVDSGETESNAANDDFRLTISPTPNGGHVGMTWTF